MTFIDPKTMYVVEPHILRVYQEVMSRLYDVRTINGDEARDMANRMEAVLSQYDPIPYRAE